MHKTQRKILSLRFFVKNAMVCLKGLIYKGLSDIFAFWRKIAKAFILQVFVKLTKIRFWFIFTKKVLIFWHICVIIFVG